MRGYRAPSSGRSRLGLLLRGRFPTLALGWVQDPGRAPTHPKFTVEGTSLLGAKYLQGEQVSGESCSKMLYCQRNRDRQGGLVDEWGWG